MNENENYDKIFEEAKNGGRYAGTYKQALKKTDAQLKKSIMSYEKQITEHQYKIENPKEYDSDWDNKDERGKIGLIKYWEKEMRNFSDEAEILKMIQRGRINNG